MADAAQLKLQVGLDLTLFRQQLAQLGTVAVGYQMPINIKFDRESIQKELARLSKLKTVISINDSQVTAATDRVDSLNKAIVALRNAAKNPIIVETKYKATGDVPGARTKAKSAVNTAVKGQSLVDNASRTELQSLYKFAKESNLQFEKLQRGAASKTEELRRVLGPAFSNVGSDILAGIKSGLADANSALSKIAAGMGATLIGKTKAVFGIASPSKVFKAIGENIVDGLEIGFIDGLKDFKNKSVDEIRKIVALLKLELAKISGVSMAPAMTRSAGGRGSQGYMSPIGPLPHGSREPWAFSEGRYQPFMTQPGQMRGASASRAGGPSIMGTISSPSMFGASFPALPSAGMTGGGGAYRQAQLQSRMAAAYTRSAAREASVLGESQMYARVSGQVPLGNPAPRLPAGNQGGALALRNAPGGGQGSAAGFGGFANAMAGIQLPGAGVISELGGEFAQAAKQVLLFGTAYKALAFLTGFPAQVSEAVAQLQTFNNTLKAITPSGEEFRTSNKFILDLVEKYNVPLQSARDGFTKLYASMAPAGFKGDEIRNIFTGISQGAATFGMSADKVDRVNYAFAQMASKGQIMSEELKGQLGDVLPGAVAIFAEAAGFTGPEAMVKFTKAMEDGRYKGAAMKQLLVNVGTVMNKEFGPGAEGAARTFQGLMNRMQNATLRLYEVFEPVAIGFANKVVLPMTDGLKVTADGFNAFFTGQKAVTKGGAELAAKLRELKPTFEGLAANVKAVADRVIDLSKAFVPLLELGAKLLATPLAGFLAQTYVSVLLLNGAFTALGGRFAVTSFVAYFSRLNTALVLSQAQMIAAGGAANAMNLRILATGPAAVGATTATGQLTLAIRGMWIAMTGPVGLAVLGIAAVTAALYAMHKPSREYLNSIPARYKSFWEDLARQAGTAARKTKEAWASLTSFFGQIINNIVKAFQEQINKLPGFVRDAVGFIAPIFEGLMPIFDRVTKWIGTNWKGMIAEMINSANPLYGIAKKFGIDVGAAAVKAGTGPAPGDPKGKVKNYTVAGITYDGNTGAPIGQSLSPFVPEVKLPPIPEATGDGGATKTQKAAKIPLEQLLDRTSSSAAQSKAAALDLALNERILQAKKDGNEEEQASLENLRPAIKLRGELASLTAFQKMLVQNEAKIVGKSLTQAQFKERLRLAAQKITMADIDLENAYVDLQKKEVDANKTKLEQQQAYQRTLEDIRIKNGEIGDEEIRRIEKRRQYQDILAANPSLTETQKTTLQQTIDAAPVDIIEEKLKSYRKNLDDLANTKNQMIGIAESIGTSFGDAFKGIITGSMTAQEALAGFFQNLSNYFADMVSKMIAEYLKMQLIKGLTSLIPGLGGMFGGGGGGGFFGAGAPDAVAGGGIFSGAGPYQFANGGIAAGGFRAFATGGIVTGPTLGLVGEGRYNEAVIPLPDGKSVPVDLGGEGARLGGNGGVSVGEINITVQNTGDTLSPAAQKQIAGQVQGIVLATMADQRRSGGLLR